MATGRGPWGRPLHLAQSPGDTGTMCDSLGSEWGVVPEQGEWGLWPSSPVSLSEMGRGGVGQALSPPVIPCTTGIPKVPISLRCERPGLLQEGRCQLSSHHPVALPPSLGESVKGHLLQSLSAAWLTCGEREAVVMAPPLCVTQEHHPASLFAWLSFTSISHHNLLSHIPSGHLPTVNSCRPCPEIAH